MRSELRRHKASAAVGHRCRVGKHFRLDPQRLAISQQQFVDGRRIARIQSDLQRVSNHDQIRNKLTLCPTDARGLGLLAGWIGLGRISYLVVGWTGLFHVAGQGRSDYGFTGSTHPHQNIGSVLSQSFHSNTPSPKTITIIIINVNL